MSNDVRMGSGDAATYAGGDDGSGLCTARTRSGKRCRGRAVTGTTVCRMHGGSAPQVLAAVQRRRADGERRAALAEWGATFGEIGPAEDPAVVMARLIRQAAGHVSWLLERVQETEADALVWGLSNEVHREGGEFPGVDTTYAAEVNGWVRLYGEERDRLVRMIAVAAKMGVDERLVHLAEIQTSMMMAILDRALDAFGLDATKPETAAVMGRVVREVMAERQQLAQPSA
ncbi:HGGxSTG domain-containing protein [Streptomyces sp. NPDC050560]|uniref:HGGxSTG domain-containing protein n=1 Tax=Streptomyces sp. NPDC050560 TaxID=3365630 RepID=UPI0037A553F2